MNDDDRTPDDVEVRLRRTLQAVAAATIVEDRRNDLLAALDAAQLPTLSEEDDDAMHLDARTDPARPIWRRPLFLAAAAALVVVAVVGAALAAGDDPDVELDPAVPDAGPTTGWYLPPEGWEITEVRTDFLDVDEDGACPCRVLIAAGEGPQPPAVVVYESVGPVDEGLADQYESIDVGGREGGLGPDGQVRVGSGGRHLFLMASGVDDNAAVIELADAWLDRVDAGEDPVAAELPLPEGMASGALLPVAAQRNVHAVDVTAVERATGRRTYYQLVPAGAWYPFLVIDAGSIAQRAGSFEITTTVGSTPMVGLVGGSVDVVVGPSFFAEEGDLDADELRAFLAAMRPASAAAWRAALIGATVEPGVLEADTLFGPPLVDTP